MLLFCFITNCITSIICVNRSHEKFEFFAKPDDKVMQHDFLNCFKKNCKNMLPVVFYSVLFSSLVILKANTILEFKM